MVVKAMDKNWEEVGKGDLYYCKMSSGEYEFLLIDVDSNSLKWQMNVWVISWKFINKNSITVAMIFMLVQLQIKTLFVYRTTGKI